MDKKINDELMPDSTEQFIIKVDDFKQSLGSWYSIFALRILPFLLYIIPINVVLNHINSFVMSRYLPDYNLNGAFLLATWIIVSLGLLAVAIFAPKAATVLEFLIGIGYLYFTFKHRLYGSPVGITVLICVILFLVVKLVFLVFELIRLKKFAKDKENNIERDESGRVVRASGEKVFFTENSPEEEYTPNVSDEDIAISDDNNEGEYVTNVADGEVVVSDDDNDGEYITKVADDEVVVAGSVNEGEYITNVADDEVVMADSVDEGEYITNVADDEVVMAGSVDESEYITNVADDEIVFAGKDNYENNTPPAADDDFFFG